MNVARALRPAQRIVTAMVVAAVATTCLVSATTSGSAAAPSSSQVAPGAAPLRSVDQSAFPALGTETYQRRVQHFVNVVRHRHHLRTLTLATCTQRAASAWSLHLATTNTFYHRSMTRLLHMCNAHYAGETLGRGTLRPSTLVRMWMHSPPHRRVLLSHGPRRIGVGATPNAQGEWVVAANFMRF